MFEIEIKKENDEITTLTTKEDQEKIIKVDNISQKIEGIQINNIKVKENEIKEGEKVK